MDHSIAEIFLTSTGQVLTLRCYPTGDGPRRLQVRTAPGTCLGYSVDVWELQPLTIKEPTSNIEQPEERSV